MQLLVLLYLGFTTDRTWMVAVGAGLLWLLGFAAMWPINAHYGYIGRTAVSALKAQGCPVVGGIDGGASPLTVTLRLKNGRTQAFVVRQDGGRQFHLYVPTGSNYGLQYDRQFKEGEKARLGIPVNCG